MRSHSSEVVMRYSLGSGVPCLVIICDLVRGLAVDIVGAAVAAAVGGAAAEVCCCIAMRVKVAVVEGELRHRRLNHSSVCLY